LRTGKSELKFSKKKTNNFGLTNYGYSDAKRTNNKGHKVSWRARVQCEGVRARRIIVKKGVDMRK
jgi:hypothetical protein